MYVCPFCWLLKQPLVADANVEPCSIIQHTILHSSLRTLNTRLSWAFWEGRLDDTIV